MSYPIAEILQIGIFALSLTLVAVIAVVAILSIINKNIAWTIITIALVSVVLGLQTLSEKITIWVGK